MADEIQNTNQNQQPINQPLQSPSTQSVPVQNVNPISPEQNPQVNQLKPKKVEPKTNKKIVIFLLLGVFGFMVFAFVILFFLINSSTSAEDNPFIQVLGIDPASWIPFLINITSAFFGFMVFVSFIVAIIGVFRIAMAKKDDKPAKFKGVLMTVVGAVFCIILIVVWMFSYLYLSKKKADQVNASTKEYILTVPEKTIGLSVPMKISFDGSPIEKLVNKTKYEILTYEWDFGDGSEFATGKKVAHLYTKKGSNGGRYKVTLIVTYKDLKDGGEKQDKFEKDIVFSNELAETQFIASPTSGAAPLEVTFDASLSVDTDGTIEKYEWDFDEDGFYDDSEGVKTTYTFNKIGNFVVKLRITDSNGDSSVSEQEIQVEEGQNPVAVITVNSEEGVFYKGKSYVFDASKSSSPASDKIVKYQWNFGDGSTANTRTASHKYEEEGSYEVSLTVVDENGLKGEDTFQVDIAVSQSAPVAVIIPTPAFTDKEGTYVEGQAPLNVSFSALDSRDPDDDIIEYKWDFDGDSQFDDTGEIASYVFKDEGEYNVVLTVVDSEDNESKKSLVVKVIAHGIEAKLTADSVQGEVPLKVNFDASSSLYPEGDIISYEWDFGNGTRRVDVAQISYTYSTVGTYTAKVRAIASDGSKSEAQVVISVRPVSITACFDIDPEIGEAPLESQFDPSCSTGTVSFYLWDFGNGKTSRDRKPTATYTKPGTYKVTLEVRDNNGVTSSVTKDIVVTGEVE